VLLKACLNGNRTRDEHPALPLSPEELARDAEAAVLAGAAALHVHPRDHTGAETLAGEHVGAAVEAIRAACPGVPVGVSTGAWIEPEVGRRAAAVAAWSPLPDFASVNLSEEGALDVCEALLTAGIGIEAGTWSVEDAELLGRSGLPGLLVRVLIEPQDRETAVALATATAIETALDAAGVAEPRLHHGYGRATWAVIGAAATRGRDIRIGLEDTLELADGTPAENNAQLVGAAAALVAS
jgi:uncharacterized protein (DUF849 family)